MSPITTAPSTISGSNARLSGRSTRFGTIEHMHARGRLTDRQKDAADRFLALYEQAQSDGVRAIDYSRERVDGSRIGDPVASALDSRKKLRIVETALGKVRYDILVDVVVDGKSLRAMAKGASRRDRLGHELVAALGNLDDLFDFRSK